MKNNLLYKIIIGILVVIILVLLFTSNKENNNTNDANNNSEITIENEELKEEKEKLLLQIDDLNNNIVELEEKVETLSKKDNTCDTSDLEKELTKFKNQVSTLKSSISTLKSNKNKLSSDIANYKDNINTLNDTIEQLSSNITSLENDKDTLNNTVQELNETITELNEDITSLNERITELTNENKTLKEEANIYTVFYSVNGETIYSEKVKKGEDVKDVPSVPENGQYDGEWTNDGKNVQSDMVLYPVYYYLLTFKGIEDVATVNRDTYKIYEDDDNKTITLNNDYIAIGEETIVIAELIDNYYNKNGWKIENNVYKDGNTYDVEKSIEITFNASYGCVAKGSKITMANGSTKNIEDIKIGDEVLGYDYYTGTMNTTKVTTVIDGNDISKVFEVKLENGNTLKIVDDEYLFDTDEKKYIAINYLTYESAIGKNVMVNDNGIISSSKIISITYAIEDIEHYTIYTEKSVNYIANNIVALAPFTFVNQRYTYDKNYKVDLIQYNEDVKKYGVYSYSDFEDVCTEDTFNNFVLKDYKIVVGKGMLTFEELKEGIKILQEEIDYYSTHNN